MAFRFRQLQAFHAVIETGTVSGAAKQLGISQPGVSNLLAQLEHSAKLDLFDRIKGRLAPTPEAMVLFREVDTLVRGLEHVNQTVTDLQNQRAGQLQVVSSHATAFGFLPAEIARFVADKPDLSIAFHSQYSAKIQEWVSAGLFEIGLCELPLLSDGLDSKVFHIEMRCALPIHAEVAQCAELTPERLHDYPFIVMGADHMVTRRLREAFHNAGASLRVRCQTDLFRNELSMVREGVGAALIDPFTLASDPGGPVVVRTFRPRILLDLVLITARGRPLSSVGREFRDSLELSLSAYATNDDLADGSKL